MSLGPNGRPRRPERPATPGFARGSGRLHHLADPHKVQKSPKGDAPHGTCVTGYAQSKFSLPAASSKWHLAMPRSTRV